jgi:glycosyltransferase involved in cell wall biosynthesis
MTAPAPLRVLHVCDHLGWEGSRMHGVKRLFSWLLPRFDESRVRTALVSLRRKDLTTEALENQGVEISYLGRSKFDPRTLGALLAIVDRWKPDILHLHNYGATNFGRVAAGMRGLPAIVHEHINLGRAPWYQKVADRSLEPLTDIALAVSRSTADFMCTERQLPRRKVRVVYLGAPVEEFARPRSAAEVADARAALGLAAGPVVGSITRLHEAKGNVYLVRAMPSVLARHPDAQLVIVGEGPLRPDLEAEAQRLGIANRVRFAGFQPDVAAALATFDVAVFPSLFEGTPLTAFEALAMGKAIVATDADGLQEILTDGVNARIVPRRDPAALADRISELLEAPDERARLARHARAAGQGYDIAALVERLTRLYETMAATRRRTSRRGAVLDEDLSFLDSGRAVAPAAV